MKIYTWGISPQMMATIKEIGWETVRYSDCPSNEAIGDNAFLFSDEVVNFKELLTFYENYKTKKLFYYYSQKNISGWKAVAIKCKELDIQFLRPDIGSSELDDYLHSSLGNRSIKKIPITGVFGSIPGIGVTAISHLLAKSQNAIHLGLNLYNGGFHSPNSENGSITLENWRMRLLQKSLTKEDAQSLKKVNGVSYLPGNQDPLAVLDYKEDEINHLTLTLSQNAKVIADFGAIPHSAAWMHGVQKSDIRIMVSHPEYFEQTRKLLELAAAIGVEKEHWFLLLNKSNSGEAKTMASVLGVQTLPLQELSFSERFFTTFNFQLNKKESDLLEKTSSLLKGV